MKFSDIVGQSVLVDRLKYIIQSERVAHAYLFVGSKGIGKRTMANIFARGLMCQSQGNKPCDLCRSCSQFNTDNHPDIYRIGKEGKASIGVDSIRNILRDIQFKPFQFNRKVYLIEDAHTMTVQAQNALLKTLEEPPESAVLLLLADQSQSLLPTVVSRCQIFRMQRLSRKEISTIIMRHMALSEERALLFAGLSEGLPGKGLQLAGSGEYAEMRDEVFAFLEKAVGQKDLQLMSYWELFQKYRDRVDALMDILILWFRDMLIYRETRDRQLVVNLDKVSLLENQMTLFTIKRIKGIIENIEHSRKMLKGNANYQLTMENLLLSL
jgi:DNA polymerase-3 subunit delta'